MSTHELTARVRELKELQALSSELQAEITSIQDEIKQVMNEQGKEEISVDVFKISYKTVNSKRFDSTAFKKTHSDLYAQYTKQTQTRRFVVA